MGPNTKCSRLLALTFLAALLAACGAGEPRRGESAWSGTIDTLENGAIHIRNPAEGIWDRATAWRLEEELRIGVDDGDGPELFGRIADIAVDAYGRIYILEGQAQEIRVFDADGNFLRTIGRRGEGPGEFQGAAALLWGPDGHLWVVDPNNARYSVFDTTGAYLTMYRRTSGMHMIPWPGGMDARGYLTDITLDPTGGGSAFRTALVTYRFEDQDPVPVDTIRPPEYDGDYFELRSESSFTRASIPFAPRMVWRYDPSGSLWSGLTDRYRLIVQDLSGDTTRIIERPFDPLPVSSADREEALERMNWFTAQGGKLDASRIPRTKPAFQSFFTDPHGYLWVTPTTSKDETGRRFDIFDPDGRYLGSILNDFASTSYAPVIIGDRFYTVTTDEFEIPYLIRARIIGRE